MYDIIIKNGVVIDGTGNPMQKADIGIKEDKIAKIGWLDNEKGEIEIDAADRFVCPGFIDVNNHSDTYWQIFLNPNLESLVYQGITTIVGGNCGSSLAPLASAETIASIQKWANIKQVNLNWLTLEEFFEAVSDQKLAVNFGTLVGHGTLRRGILRDQVKDLGPEEFAFVEKMLVSSLKEGALGMSSGLIYTHARNASTDELIKLAKTVKKYDGVYVSHIRDERNYFTQAIEEAIKIAKKSEVKLHISHLKVMGKDNWELMDDALYLLDNAKESGMDVTFDVYPYTNTGSVLYTLLPGWVAEGGKKMMLRRLKDPAIRSKVVSEMRGSGFDYSKIEIAISPLTKTLAKRKISEIASSQEKSVEDAVVDILIASEGRVIVSMEVLSEENVEKAVTHPLSIISTNGSGYNLEHAETGELAHPRNFGTFPKVFSNYVLKKKLLSWEDAVRKMSWFPAQKFGIEKRGKLEEKYFADIVIFNRDEIGGLATAETPYRYSKGIDFLLVNGKLVISEGKYTGIRNGRVVRK